MKNSKTNPHMKLFDRLRAGFARNFNKINKVDLIVAVILVGIFTVLAVGRFKKPTSYDKTVYLKARVTENAGDIENEAKNMIGKQVYFNGLEKPVELVAAKTEKGELFLVVKSTGEIAETKNIFDGERVATGQKAEIHSIFQAKTIITDLSYEPFPGY